jgi:hypothetical protein
MKKILLLLGHLVLMYDLHCQNKHVLINEISNLSAIKSAQEVTYYGLDFSLLKFISPSNAFKDQEIKEQYLGAWLAFYQKEIPPEKYLRKWIDFKEGFNYNPGSVQIRMESISNDWVVVTPINISKDQVIETIKSYQLPENAGLGFVIHPVVFDEITKEVFCFFTFFNIKTKEIYWIVETKEEGMGIGLKQIYGLGLVQTTKYYVDEVYKKNLKR